MMIVGPFEFPRHATASETALVAFDELSAVCLAAWTWKALDAAEGQWEMVDLVVEWSADVLGAMAVQHEKFQP